MKSKRLIKNIVIAAVVYISICSKSFLGGNVYGQNVGINTSGSLPNPSAILDIFDTTRGLLIPRMNILERNNITSPAQSLLIYNTDDSCFQSYLGTTWQNVWCASTSTPPAGCTGVPSSVSAIASPNPVCQGNTLSLSGSATGALWWIWSGPNGFLSATQNSSVPTISTSGTYTLIAINACGPSLAANTSYVSVTPEPVATFSYTSSSYCPTTTPNPVPIYAPATCSSSGGVAGVFSASPSGLVFISGSPGQIDLTHSNGGTYTVTNSVTGTGGCGLAVATTTVTIDPTATFSYGSSSYCNSNSSSNPTPSFTAGSIAGTFTASPSGLAFISSSTGQIDLTHSNAGVYTVTNTVITGSCTMVATTAVTIQSASFSYTATPYCSNYGTPTVLLGTGAIAGTFTATPSGLTIISTSGAVTSGSSFANTYTVTNTLASGCSATSPITITALPNTTFSYTGSPYCNSNGSANPLPTLGAGATDGSFTISPSSGLSITASGASAGQLTLSGSTPGTYTVTNTLPAAGGCSAATYTSSVNVQSASFTYPGTPYCINYGTPTVLLGTDATAGTFTATPTGLTIISTSGAVTSTSSIVNTYTVTNTLASGCSATSPITISTLPSAAFSYSGSPFCSSTGVITPTITGIAGTFTATPSGLHIVPASNGQINISLSNPGTTYTITNTIISGGCTATATATITISPNTATFSYAGSPYCPTTGLVTPTTIASGTFTFSPAGLSPYSPCCSINDFTTLGDAVISSSTVGTTYTVTHVVVSSTCTMTATSPLTIDYPGTFSYPAGPYCNNSLQTLTPTIAAGSQAGTFSIAPATGGPTVNSLGTVTIPSGSTAGTYTVTNTMATGCAYTSTFVITALPSAAFSYPLSPYCPTTGLAFPTYSGGGVAGTFSASPSSLDFWGASFPGDIWIDLSPTGTTYTVTNSIAAASGCPAVTYTNTVAILSNGTFSYSGSPFCNNTTHTVSPTLSGGGSGTFSISPANAFVTVNSSGVATITSGAPAGTYTVTNTMATGCAYTTTFVITAMPTANFSYTLSPYCPTTFLATPTITGTSGTYSASPTGLVWWLGTPPDIEVLSSAPGTTYTVTNTVAAASGCPAVTYTNTIAILSNGTFSYSGSPFCNNTTQTISPTLSGGGSGTFSISPVNAFVTVSSTGVVTITSGAPAGTYTVTNTIAAGCAYTTTFVITAMPTANFSYTLSPYCPTTFLATPTITGTSGTYSASPTGLVWWLGTPPDIEVLSSAPGTTYTVTNTVAAASGCPVVTYTNTVSILNNGTFSYSGSPFCNNTTQTASPTLSGGGSGTFSISPVNAFVTVSSTGVVTITSGAPAGTYTVTNTIAAGCAYTTTFVITALPTANFSYTLSPYCPTTFSASATVTGTSGTFSYSPTGLAWWGAAPTVYVSTSTPGTTYTVTNTVAAAGGCPVVTYTNTIGIDPIAAFSYTATPYCPTLGSASPSFATGAIAGTFTATPATLQIGSTTGIINLVTSPAGTYTVTNKVVTGSCTITATATVTVQNTGTFSYTGSPYCKSTGYTNPLPTFSAGCVAGTFSASSSNLVFISTSGINAGEIDLTNSLPGTYTVTNTIAAGCTYTATVTIEPTATFTYPFTPYCSNYGTATILLATGSVAGTFSVSPPTGLLSIITSGVDAGQVNTSASSAGTYTVTNTVVTGSCTVTAPATITITALPSAAFSYTATPYCPTGGTAIPTITGTAGTFSAPSGLVISSTSGIVTLGTSTPGTYVVTNTVAAAGGCPAVTYTTSINIEQSLFNYSTGYFCGNASDPQPTMGSGAVVGVLSALPSGLTFLDPSTGLVSLTGSNPGTYTVTNTVTTPSGCVVFTQGTITIGPQIGFTYANPYCQGSGTTAIPTPNPSNSIFGTFSSSLPGLTMSSSTGAINVDGSSPGTYNITNSVTAYGQTCLATSVINIEPFTTFSYAGGPFTTTSGLIIPTIPSGAVAGTFAVSPTGSLTITSTGQIDCSTGIAGTTYTITNTIAGGCSYSYSLTINP